MPDVSTQCGRPHMPTLGMSPASEFVRQAASDFVRQAASDFVIGRGLGNDARDGQGAYGP